MHDMLSNQTDLKMLGSSKEVAAASHVNCQMVKSWHEVGSYTLQNGRLETGPMQKCNALGRMSDYHID